jgi:acylphosphatase
MKNTRAHVTIKGRVQGVGFRFSTVHQADRLGLAGWVKNTWSGDVEAEFEGPEKNVSEMVRWCHDGPRSARVSSVDVEYGEPTGRFQGFQVRG